MLSWGLHWLGFQRLLSHMITNGRLIVLGGGLMKDDIITIYCGYTLHLTTIIIAQVFIITSAVRCGIIVLN